VRLKCLERSFSRPSRQAKSREHPPKEVIPLLLSRARVPTLSNRSKMTLDYGSETPLRELVSPPSLLSYVPLRSGQAKLFTFQAKLFDLWQNAEAIPQHRPKQHVVCLHHFDRPMKLERHLDGRNRRESTAKGDVAFLPADAPTMLRLGKDDPNQLLSYSYLVFEADYLAELALSNGIGRPLDFIPAFATPDPVLHEITAALTSAPQIKDPAANLFVESLFNAAAARISV
jgi:hypothetical protein